MRVKSLLLCQFLHLQLELVQDGLAGAVVKHGAGALGPFPILTRRAVLGLQRRHFALLDFFKLLCLQRKKQVGKRWHMFFTPLAFPSLTVSNSKQAFFSTDFLFKLDQVDPPKARGFLVACVFYLFSFEISVIFLKDSIDSASGNVTFLRLTGVKNNCSRPHTWIDLDP